MGVLQLPAERERGPESFRRRPRIPQPVRHRAACLLGEETLAVVGAAVEDLVRPIHVLTRRLRLARLRGDQSAVARNLQQRPVVPGRQEEPLRGAETLLRPGEGIRLAVRDAEVVPDERADGRGGASASGGSERRLELPAGVVVPEAPELQVAEAGAQSDLHAFFERAPAVCLASPLRCLPRPGPEPPQ
ncbi:MAG: hypothetical protein O7J95_05045 [Planctomycetota bacterium]|nr:hypothetical protein [Planctomycetota bacterium]